MNVVLHTGQNEENYFLTFNLLKTIIRLMELKKKAF